MMDIDVLITGGVGIITTITSGWTSWVFARKKYNAEVDSAKIENLAKIIDVLDELIKNLLERLNASQEQNKSYELQLLDYLKQLTDVRLQVSELMMKLIDLHVVNVKKPIRKTKGGK